jgi:hypothetical protein
MASLWNGMSPRARVGAVLIAALVASGAYLWMTGAPGLADTNREPDSLADGASSGTGSADGPVGLPGDPLPAPMPVPDGHPDEIASVLAPMVAAGGPDALPALLAALQKSGIAVYGPDNAVAVQAGGPDEGLSFESWQVRAMLGVVGRRRASVSLSSLAVGLAAKMPALRDQPVAQELAADIVKSANGDDPVRRFWARFIAELGRHRPGSAAYDLLGNVDPSAVRLDPIQLAMIALQLQAEITTAAGAPLDSAARPSRPSLLDAIFPTLYAAAPCNPSPNHPRPSVSRGVFMSLIMSMSSAVNQVGRDLTQNLRDYQNLILLLNAVKVDVELEGGSALRRTKTTTAGEARKVRATVSINSSLLEWDNCFAEVLGGRVPDWRRPGPLPGIPVDWNLQGGEIVRIPTGAPGNERGLPDGTRTDNQGFARLAVEGSPQSRNLPETAKEERRQVAATASVKLKFADLVHRTAGSLPDPNNWLFDQEFTLDVPYPFEVMDWTDGAGRWTGSISVVETTISTYAGDGTGGATQSAETATTKVTYELTETVSENGSNGTVFASVKGRVEGSYDVQKTHSSWQLKSCGAVKDRRMNNTSQEAGTATKSGTANIMVTIFDDGRYVIAAHSEELQANLITRFQATLDVFGQNCVPIARTDARESVPMLRNLGALAQANGTVDRNNPNALMGEVTEDSGPPASGGSGRGGTRTVKTIKWNLRRQ